MNEERTITIDIRLSRGWVAVLSCFLIIAVLIVIGTIKQQTAVASTGESSATSSSVMR